MTSLDEIDRSGAGDEPSTDIRAAGERYADGAFALPSDMRTVFLGGLFILAAIAALYAAGEIVLPIVMAFILPGAILSVPMLAIAKIVCDRIRPLMALGHFLEA